jgi:flap endonuclease-1
MGVPLKDITIRHEVELSTFAGKTLSVDAFNILYQFLASIRQRDGSALTDSKGRVTSHLVGLLSRTTRFREQGIRLIFVFDGKPPALKEGELRRRAKLKEQAYEEFKKAKEEGDMQGMHKFSSRLNRLTPEMVQSAKELLTALGIPYIDAPSEGEAQAAHLVKKGDAYACISQDFDNLLFGVPRLLQNATLTEKRKLPSKLSYETVKPLLVDLEENLKAWGITRKQLIALSMLVGTDFNPEGIPKIGPKNALRLVREHGEDFDALFTHVQWDSLYPFAYTKVFDTIHEMPVTDEYSLQQKTPDNDAVLKMLCKEYGFGEQRVKSALETLEASEKTHAQRSLMDF